MKLLHYNVYCGQGCKTDATEEKLAKLGAWLKAQAADVVGLTECNNWDKLPLARIAEGWGYPHIELLVTKSGYHVVLLAKLPIERFEDAPQSAFYHGMLHCRVNGVHIIELHLNPNGAALRRREVLPIADIVRGATCTVDAAEAVVVMGDFNNVSPVDRPWHDSSGLLQTMAECSRAERLRCRHMTDAGEIDYAAIEHLTDAGLQDVTPRRDDSLTDPTAKVAPPWTYPSPMRADQTDDPCLRIDLSMVNAPCLAQWDVQVKVLRDATVDTLSDHYPLCTTLLPKP